MIAALAVAGALVGATDRGWLAALGLSRLRRVLYGAAAGAGLGLLLIPLLGLLAAVVVFVVALAAAVALVCGLALLLRHLGRSRD